MAVALASGVAVAALGLLVVKPIYEGWSTARVADRELAATQADFDEKADRYHQSVDLNVRTQVLDDALDAQPAWGDVYRLVLASLPTGTDIDQVSATVDGDEVTATVSVTLRGGSYADLTRWLSTLQTTDGVVQAWSTGFSQREDVASFVVALRLEAGDSSIPPVTVAPAPAPTVPDPTPTTIPGPLDQVTDPTGGSPTTIPAPTTPAEEGN